MKAINAVFVVVLWGILVGSCMWWFGGVKETFPDDLSKFLAAAALLIPLTIVLGPRARA